MNYDVIQSPSLEELIKLVNERMQDNWQPIGGMNVVLYYGTYIFTQAATKHDDKWYGKDTV